MIRHAEVCNNHRGRSLYVSLPLIIFTSITSFNTSYYRTSARKNRWNIFQYKVQCSSAGSSCCIEQKKFIFEDIHMMAECNKNDLHDDFEKVS
jgi:hypothetical protein